MNGDLNGDRLVTPEDQAELNGRLENLLSENAMTRDTFMMACLKENGLPWPLSEEQLSAALTRLPWLNGYLYVGLKGDVNGDGEVKTQDYAVLKTILEGKQDNNMNRYANGDMDGDGRITLDDLALLKKLLEST